MREVQRRQMQFGQVAIGDIWLDPKSRDDIPAVLKGLQHLYVERRGELFGLLEAHIRPGTDRTVGRPGMDLWRILVLGVLKQGLGCGFDRLHDLANNHRTVRAMLAHGDFADESHYELQTLIDNVSLLTPQLLSAVGRLVVDSGHAVAGKKPGGPLRGRCDSFAVETDVHYPTDVSLLWDAMRCSIREAARAARRHGIDGWRQWRHLSNGVRSRFNGVRSTRRAKGRPERVKAYLARCGALLGRVERTLKALEAKGAAQAELAGIRDYVEHARRQMDQVERRLLKGEAIPHEEKVFSIFEPHTRWVTKGKAGKPVELGVPVCVVEDQFQFLLHHKIQWTGGDVDMAVSMVKETQALHPELRVCSFDRGFHSPENRARLDGLLDLNVLPRKGRPPRGGSIRRWSRPSTRWSAGAWTAFAPMARTGSSAPWRCRCWPPTCTGWAGCCASASAGGRAAPPERANPAGTTQRRAIEGPAGADAPARWKSPPPQPSGAHGAPPASPIPQARPLKWSQTRP